MGAWHCLDIEGILEKLDTDLQQGLSPREAARRLQQNGLNTISERARPSAVAIFMGQFRDFMVLVLLGAALASAFLGEAADAVTIWTIVVLNAILGFIQEFRAERAMEALRRLTAPTAKVIRGGAELEIPASEVVIGDILRIESGDRVPADARLAVSAELAAVEASLTGESAPVSKRAMVYHDPEIPLGDRRNMIYMGTTIARGRGRAIAVATGMATEMGKIAGMIQEAGGESTPLQKRLRQLGGYLVYACLAVSLVVTVAGIIKGEPLYRMLMSGVSLAVAAIPEGLPAVVTIALALGVQRMIKAHALVRKLPAVETLGCATVICSDKTGTLTRNEMTVRAAYVDGTEYQVTGEGYTPDGQFLARGQQVDPSGNGGLRLLLTAAALCNNARLGRERQRGGSGTWEVSGDPTEGALLVAAAKAGIWRERLEESHRRVAEVPFESDRRRMSVLCEGPGGDFLYLKGAPDTVVGLCCSVYRREGSVPLTRDRAAEILKASDRMAGRALRVLAVAYRPLRRLDHKGDTASLESDLILLGLVGLMDPPRPEAALAVARCHRAGIKTVMITGDHRLTAEAVAREIGILREDGLLVTGDQLEAMSDRELAGKARQIQVYARVSPRHKLRIVRALKACGEVVAMTGDGVNDAPAVKEADIGIAMGKTGTDVTKEASSMVLADDNFATIVGAVEEGRAIYDNIRKFIRYLLSCNVGEVLVMLIAALTMLPLPLVPIQMLWVNLVTDGLPAMALGVNPPEDDIMDRPPRPPGESVFARRLGRKIVMRGALIGLATLGAFVWALAGYGWDIDRARTVAFATLVMSQLIHAFDCRSERKSVFDMGLTANPQLLGAVAVSTAMLVGVIYLPALRPSFKTVPLSAADWGMVLGASCSAALSVGLRRVYIYKVRKGSLAPRAKH